MISVVIPCYNVATWLEECVQSVLDVGSDVEIILVDNNSTDTTREVMARLSHAAHVHIFQETKPGAPAARNRGLQEAKGDFIQFLDADDLLLPGKFRAQLTQPAEIMAAGYTRLGVDGNEVQVSVSEDVWKGLFDTRFGITSSNLFRTQAVREVGGWNEELKSSQEYDLMFRILKQGGEHSICQEPLAIVRERESGQISQGDASGRWNRYLDLRESVLAYLRDEKTDYFSRESTYFHQAFFDQIRILSNADPTAAIAKYRSSIPRNFKPQPSPATGKGFLSLMSVIGFAGATRLKRLLK